MSDSSGVIAASLTWPFVDGWSDDLVGASVVPFVSDSSGVIAASLTWPFADC